AQRRPRHGSVLPLARDAELALDAGHALDQLREALRRADHARPQLAVHRGIAEHLGAGLDRIRGRSLRAEDGAVADRQMTRRSGAAGKKHALPDHGAAGEAGLRAHRGVSADLHAVRDLHLVVDLHVDTEPCTNVRVPAPRATRVRGLGRGVRADLAVVADLDRTRMRYANAHSVGARGEAEARRADHCAVLHHHAPPQAHALAQVHTRVQLAVVADLDA